MTFTTLPDFNSTTNGTPDQGVICPYHPLMPNPHTFPTYSCIASNYSESHELTQRASQLLVKLFCSLLFITCRIRCFKFVQGLYP